MAENTTTTTNTAQQLTMSPAQPTSRLHGLPQELKELVFSFAVALSMPIPARVHLRDVEIDADADDDSDTTSNSTRDSSTSSATFTTLVKVTPRQPALCRIDTGTRPTVLRIFYTQNTFLFRAHAYDEAPAAQLARRHRPQLCARSPADPPRATRDEHRQNLRRAAAAAPVPDQRAARLKGTAAAPLPHARLAAAWGRGRARVLRR